MSSLSPTATAVNPTPAQGPDMPYYRRRAQATRSRRQYNRPTAAQKAAFAKSLARDGRSLLTAEECRLLAEHPYLLPVQRAEFAAMAEGRA